MKIASISKPLVAISSAVIARAQAIFAAKKVKHGAAAPQLSAAAAAPTPVPAPAAPKQKKSARQDLFAKFTAIQDPTARAAFYAANSALMMADDSSEIDEADLSSVLESLPAAELADLADAAKLVNEATKPAAACQASAPSVRAVAMPQPIPKSQPAAVRAPVALPSIEGISERSARVASLVSGLNALTSPAAKAQFYAENAEIAFGPSPAISGAERRALLKSCALVTDPSARAKLWSDINAHPAKQAVGAEYRRLAEEYKAIRDPRARAQFWADHLSLN